ncbi:methylenetetrahydromethanopterin dehydrogenase [Aureimonas sp. SA4125]|uniref:NAD(P)-dependent methylenetetrahydromethanopterin dehydrogenase n=1 Tax=Aureimonas sp. SA4125 TaxID=2826993 RepID=UPI001CC512CC|nr:NAD(P)-dependent methylenetetrahydromethanopterin dehydrogenase [Aureimonas sp. SA4125]BDA86309.1 methylenetetrahydromethanopterin dehydrogenase [Aureimonas sp. SA4125]
MTAKNILHMLTPHRHVSPFDVNMAADAGFDVIVPYENVTLDEVGDLVQDAMFSRPPHDGASTAIFFGGDDAVLALDMIDAAKKARVSPFGTHAFADPQGSFTTAAAMVACTEKVLKEKKNQDLKGTRIAVFGATGVVGYCAAVIAALEGAKVTLVGHSGLERVKARADEMKQRFGVDVAAVNGASDAEKADVLAETEVVFAAAKAGVRVLTTALLAGAPKLLAAADVNAVPPSGIEGIDVFDLGKEIAGTETHGIGALGIGALAIGNVKYQTESGLFKRMIASDEVLVLDFRDAFTLARTLVPDL